MRVKRKGENVPGDEKKFKSGEQFLNNYIPEFICKEYPDFGRTLRTHGITLSSDPKVPHRIRCEAAEFVFNLQSNLKHQTADVLDDFKSGFGKLMEGNPLGTVRDMEKIDKVDTQTDRISSSSIPPLPCLLIRVYCLQLRICSELLVPFTDPDFVPVDDHEFLSARIVHCFRHGLYGFIQEPDEIIKIVFEIIDYLDNDFKCEAIQCLTVFPDNKHDEIVQFLLGLFETDFAAYLKPVLDAYCSLNICKEMETKFQTAVMEKIDTFGTAEIPLVTRYLLYRPDTELSARSIIDSIGTVINLSNFKEMSHSSTPNSSGLPDFEFNNLSISQQSMHLKQSADLRDLSGVLSHAILTQRLIAPAIFEMISDLLLDSNQVNDLQLLFIFHLIRTPSTAKKAGPSLDNLILNGNLDWKFLERWMCDYPSLVVDFQTQLIDLALMCLTNGKSFKINEMGRSLFTNLFTLVPEKRNEISTELIVHISSGLRHEAHFALKAFECIPVELLQQQNSRLKNLVEADVSDYSNTIVRRIYSLIASVTTYEDKPLLLTINRQIRHFDIKTKRVGIIGAIQAIGVLGIEGRNHIINSEDTQNGSFTQVATATQQLMCDSSIGTRRFRIIRQILLNLSKAPSLTSLINDELTKLISQKNIDTCVLKYIRDKMFLLFKQKWLDPPIIDSMTRKSFMLEGYPQYDMRLPNSMEDVDMTAEDTIHLRTRLAIDNATNLELASEFAFVATCSQKLRCDQIRNLTESSIDLPNPTIASKWKKDQKLSNEKQRIFLDIHFNLVGFFRECLNVSCLDDNTPTSVLIERLRHIDEAERALMTYLKIAHTAYQPPQPHHDVLDMPKNPVKKTKGKEKGPTKSSTLVISQNNTISLGKTIVTGPEETSKVELSEEWRLTMREFNPRIYRRLLNIPFYVCSNQETLSMETAHYAHSHFHQLVKYKLTTTKLGLKATHSVGRTWISTMDQKELFHLIVDVCENSIRTVFEVMRYMEAPTFDDQLLNLAFVIIGWMHIFLKYVHDQKEDEILERFYSIIKDELHKPLHTIGKLIKYVNTGRQLKSVLVLVKRLLLKEKGPVQKESKKVLYKTTKILISKSWLQGDINALEDGIVSLIEFGDDTLEEITNIYDCGIMPLLSDKEPKCDENGEPVLKLPGVTNRNFTQIYKVLFMQLVKVTKKTCSVAARQSDDFIERWGNIACLFGELIKGTKIGGTPKMFHTMMVCGRQITDLYSKYAVPVMESNWEYFKADGEYLNNKIKKCVIVLRRACDFIQAQNKNKKHVQCMNQVPMVTKTTEEYLHRMRIFEVARTGEAATIRRLGSKEIFEAHKLKNSLKKLKKRRVVEEDVKVESEEHSFNPFGSAMDIATPDKNSSDDSEGVDED